MLVSQTAEYALRAMAHLSQLPEGGSARAQDVSSATGIPVHYASKVLRRLAEKGLIVGQKGHGGGFRLSRAAKDIRFKEVLEAADDALDDQNTCAFGWGKCNAQNPCALHNSVTQLRTSVTDWATRTTLADLTPRKQKPRSR